MGDFIHLIFFFALYPDIVNIRSFLVRSCSRWFFYSPKKYKQNLPKIREKRNDAPKIRSEFFLFSYFSPVRRFTKFNTISNVQYVFSRSKSWIIYVQSYIFFERCSHKLLGIIGFKAVCCLNESRIYEQNSPYAHSTTPTEWWKHWLFKFFFLLLFCQQSREDARKKYIEKLHYIQRNVHTKILSESCCVAYIQAKELLDLIHEVNPHCKPRWDDKRRIWRKNALFTFVIEKYILLLLFFSFIEFSIWRIQTKPNKRKLKWICLHQSSDVKMIFEFRYFREIENSI